MPFHFRKDLVATHIKKTIGITALLVASYVITFAQTPASRVKITVTLPSAVQVEVEDNQGSNSWSFRNAYGSVLGLGERIKEFQVMAGNRSVSAAPISSGEFRTDKEVTRYRYRVELPKPEPGSMSHVSWLTNERGFLMLADLLPQNLTEESRIALEFLLPPSWMIGSSINSASNEFLVENPETSVFYVGTSLRRTSKAVDGMTLQLLSTGSWPTSDAQVLAIAAKILKTYSSLTGFRLRNAATVMLAPVPARSSVTSWKAETRGSSVVLLMDPNARFSTWSGQLGVIFTHELLHLWVPNSLSLRGDYDWFFEGFTLYQGLLTALQLKLINFQEYLDTLARVYDSYLSYSDGLSLLEASERRWTTTGSLVYDKGMLVAFIYDLMLRTESQGRTTLSTLYVPLFANRAEEPANGNDVIIKLLSASPATVDFPKTFIERRTTIELDQILARYGLQLDSSGTRSSLSIKKDLNPAQKKVLRSLGYKKG